MTCVTTKIFLKIFDSLKNLNLEITLEVHESMQMLSPGQLPYVKL